MRRIYTRSGDKGTTGIHGGARIPKDDIRIEANGCLDELNTIIGIVRSMLPPAHEWQTILYDIQKNLMVVMSHVATPSAIRVQNPNTLPTDMVDICERTMDTFTAQMEDNHHFILPGGTQLASQLHFARVVCRRSERRLWTLNRHDELPPLVLQYINRLSDLFFVMARYDVWKQQWSEEKWHLFTYKQKIINKQE